MSTPSRSSSHSSTPTAPDSPLSWRHPKFEEIIRRQKAATFSEQNISTILYNCAALVSLWIGQKAVESFLPTFYLADWLYPFWDYFAHGVSYLLLGLRILFLYNILIALQPLIRAKDDLSDIPLTPAQRKLLGLEPTSTPPTPGSTYVTPPRFTRTSHSGSRSPGGRSVSYSNSPRDSKKPSPFDSGKQGSPSGKLGSSINNSPSYNSSPLLHKAMGGGRNNLRRQSYGSPSPLGPGVSRGIAYEGPSTPSPPGGKGANLGLNNKWLYERNKASPVPKMFY